MLTKAQRLTESELDALDSELDGRMVHRWMPALARRADRNLTADQRAERVDAVEWEIAFRPPTRLEMLEFKKACEGANPDRKALAEENLCRACVRLVAGAGTTPVNVAFDAIYEHFTGMPAECAKTLIQVAGLTLGTTGNA